MARAIEIALSFLIGVAKMHALLHTVLLWDRPFFKAGLYLPRFRFGTTGFSSSCSYKRLLRKKNVAHVIFDVSQQAAT